MAEVPQWVRNLKPAGPQGSDVLAQERKGSNVDVDRLSTFLFGKEALDRKRTVLKTLQSEKVFDKSQDYFEGRVDKFERALGRGKKLQQLAVKHQWGDLERRVANDLISEPLPYALHEGMYLVTIRDQGTPEQHEKYLKPAEAFKHIGCYAQTELGHGSNVRGLETTATWNPDDKTFTIHSPHLTSSKWWIGSLGRTANHASVMAQLIIGGKSYGPHPFIVPIRDLKTHELLPNVYAGDIGPKFGYNTMDNGFLLFNQVKVPHDAMLARYSAVDPKTNKYIKPSSPTLVYGTLTWVRSTIVLQSGTVLARGVTIATRYLAVRRQFQDRDAPEWQKGENQTLNYTMVQIRLLPLLASCFALHFTGKGMMALYEANQRKMKQNTSNDDRKSRGAGPEETQSGSDLLSDLHGTSCGLKSLCSSLAAEGLETCRRAMGGHGYSAFAGVGHWFADYVPTCTWEGDNYMLTQQVARYLLKSARATLKGNEPNNDTTEILSTFLKRQDIGAAFDVLGKDDDLVAAFAWRSAYYTFEALKHRDEQKQSWNSLLVQFYKLSRAHSQYLVVKNFWEQLHSNSIASELSQETVSLMHTLFRLYALHTLETESAEFFTSSACTVAQIRLARQKVMHLMEEIRPHAVKLVDAWDFPDWQLNSSLGRYDGKVYEDMFYRASELNPLNKATVDPYPDSDVLFKKNESAQLKGKL